MATILHARDVMLQDATRIRYIRGTKNVKASEYPWVNEFTSPLNPSLFSCTSGFNSSIINPDGDPSLLVIPNAVSGVHGLSRIYFNASAPFAVGTHTIQQEMYIKDDGSASFYLHCNLRFQNTGNTITRNTVVRINPVDGTVAFSSNDTSTTDSSWSVPTVKIILLDNNWWKVVVTATATVIAPGVDILSCYFGIVQPDGLQNYIGDGVHGLFMYAPQMYESAVDELIGDTYTDNESSSVYRWNGASWDIQYSKSQTFKQQTQPVAPQDGDIWLKTDGSGNIIEVYEYVNGVWELYPNAVSGMLTKESAVIACDANGTVTGSYSSVGGTFNVYAGNAIVNGTGSVIFSVNTEAFVDATINTSTGVYTLASLTGDTGTVILRAVYTSATGVTTTIDKTYTLTKAKAGTDGTDGLDGTAGPNGANTATVYIYKRSPTTVTVPSADATYTFATKTLAFNGGVNDGWLTDIVSGSDPLWVSAAVATSTTATAVIDGSDGTDGSDWAAPAKLTENGLNSASIYLYKRTSTTAVPAVPTASVTYTFATAAISPTAPSGWTKAVPSPSEGKYLWLISAAAVSAYTTDSIAAGEWSVPIILNINGANGFTLIPSSNITIVNGNGAKKESGTAAWDSHVYSQEGFNAGAYVSAKFVDTTKAVAFGLDTAPTASTSRDSLEYAWYGLSNGNVEALISGVKVYPSTGTVVASTSSVYAIAYDNTSTKFIVDGVVVYTEYNEAANQTLFFDSSFFHVAAEISDIIFAPIGSASAPQLVLSCTRQSFTFDGTGVASPSTQTLVASAALKNTSGTVSFVYRLYNASGGQIGTAVTMTNTANTATMQVSVFTAQPTAKYAVLTATLGSLSDTETISRLDNGSDNITVDLTNAAHTLPAYANGFVTSYTGASTRVLVYRGVNDVSSEAWTWTPTASTAGITASMGSGVDKNLLTVSAMADAVDSGYVDIAVSRTGYVTQTKRFTLAKSKGGNPNFNLVAGAGTALVVFPNGITKPSGSNLWDSEVYTLEAYANGAYCSAQPLNTNTAIMFGLNTNPNVDPNYTSLDYAWYFQNNGNLDTRINGASIVSAGTYTTNTVLSMVYDNKYVYWMKDGVIVRSVNATSGLKLYFDTSIHTTGTGLKNIAFGPAGSAGIDSVTTSLSKETVVLAADSNGNVQSFSSANTTMTVMVGSADESTAWTYTTTATGCTIGTGANTRAITISAMSADTASVVFTATKTGSIYPAQTKTFTLSKNRGAVGKIANRSLIKSFRSRVSPTASSSCYIAIKSNGQIEYMTQIMEQSANIFNQEYYVPATTGIGSTWWVRVTLTGGDAFTGLTSGSWYQLSSTRTVTLTQPGGVIGEKSNTLLIDLAETSGGTVFSTGQAAMQVFLETGA